MYVLTNSFRNKLDKYSYLETSIIMGLYLSLGYYFNSEDICMFESKLSILTILLAIITLFHGVSNGLLAIVIIGITMKFSYDEFIYEYFLSEFVLVLIFGEFHYYWNRKISEHAVQSDFINKKLSELGKAFFMLKISHDQIEKSYVSKPMSLRNSIGMIKNSLKSEGNKEGYEQLLTLIKKTANIESAYVGSVNKHGTINILAQSDSDDMFDSSDLMVKKALEEMMPIYVSSNVENYASQYLAVIPAVSNKEILGLFVIKKMPFLAFNRDSMITVSILVSYFFDELNKVKILKSMDKTCHGLQDNFRFEVYRQHIIYKKHGIESTLLIWKSYDKLQTHLLVEKIEKKLRALEVLSLVENNTYDIIAILFPLSGKSSVKGFLYHLDVAINLNTDIEYSIFSIADLSLVTSYMEDLR